MEFNVAFTKNELCDFLIRKGVEEDDAKRLREEKVDGETFQDISEDDLKEIGIKLGSRKKILKIIQNSEQSLLPNAELQNTQILGGDSNLSNALVFDLIPAGSSCSTVLPSISSATIIPSISSPTIISSISSPTIIPSISSATSLACSTTKVLPVSLCTTVRPTISSTTIVPTISSTTSLPCSTDKALSIPSCSVVLPRISSTESLAYSTTTALPTSSTTFNTVSALKRNKTSVKRTSKLKSKFLLSILSEETSDSSDANFCTEDVSKQALATYSSPKNINVLAMLEENSSGKTILKNLKSGNSICKTDVNEIVRIVVHGMIDDLCSLYPTAMQKLNLAKALVRDLPELKSTREGAAGYEPFYDPRNNSGSIEWRLKTLRVGISASVKKNKFRKGSRYRLIEREENEETVIDEEAKKKLDWLKSQPAVEINKEEILKSMEETFQVRRDLIAKRGLSLAGILEEFPVMKEFDGAIIDADFKLMCPNARNLFDVLPEYSEKIINYVTPNRADIVYRIGNIADENFKAIMYLADLLPAPRGRKRKLEDDRVYHPSEVLVTFVGQEDAYFSQESLLNHPRLLCCGEKQEEQLQFFLILDNEFVDLGKCFIKAFDILYKSHKVFNLDYPKDLVNFYNFFDTMIYKINTVVVNNAVAHLHNVISVTTT